MAIQIGSVVRLKSGGAFMTVSHIDEGKALCDWQNRTPDGYAPQQRTYKLDVLAEATQRQIEGIASAAP